MHESVYSILLKPVLPLILICMLFHSGTLQAREWQRIDLKGIVIEAEIVKSDSEQQLGLGNRFSLPDGQGMLFLYDEPGTRIFWMKRMNFPIDIIWFRGRTVVHSEENVPYPSRLIPDDELARYGSGISADMVLELPAGSVKRYGIKPGDQIRFRNQQ